MLRATELKNKSESGVAAVLFVILVPVLAILLYYVIDVGYTQIVRTQLQVAADNAALAGSSKLNSAQAGFDGARTTALDVLKEHSVLSGFSGTKSLNLAALNDADTDHSWDLTGTHNLRVVIERGFWGRWGYDSGPYQFTSFEDEGTAAEQLFQNRYPGIPRALVGNAVRVQILRPQTSLLGKRSYSLEATAIAVAAEAKETNVAPFALPICSFVTSDGKFYGENNELDLCRGDRIFTRADRYEPLVAKLGGAWNSNYPTPSFAWNSCSEMLQPSSFAKDPDATAKVGPIPEGKTFLKSKEDYTHWVNGVNPFFKEGPQPDAPKVTDIADDSVSFVDPDPICIFDHGYSRDSARSIGIAGREKLPQRIFPENALVSGVFGSTPETQMQSTDHYGVLGLPGTLNIPNGKTLEDLILELVQTSSGKDGVAPVIDPTSSANLGDNFTILESGPTKKDLDAAIWNTIVNSPTKVKDPKTDIGTIERTYSTFQTTTGTLDTVHKTIDSGIKNAEGLCNSHRAKILDSFQVLVGASKSDLVPPFRSLKTTPKDYTLFTKVAKSKAEDLDPAHSSLPVNNDETGVWTTKVPVIAPLGQSDGLRCVGLAAGAKTRTYGATTKDPLPSNSDHWIVVGFVNLNLVDVDIGNPLPQTKATINGDDYRLKNWGFLEGELDQCNLVRARVTCEPHFLPSSQGKKSQSPRLVQ